MGERLKNAAKVIGEALNNMAERDAEIREMTREIMRNDYRRDVDYAEAEKIAAILIDHAKVTWK